MQILLLIIAFIIGMLYVYAIVSKSLQSQGAEVIEKKFKGVNVLKKCFGANFFGQEFGSKLRGNGVLVLTDEKLYFEMLLPRKEIVIPIPSIVGVEIVKWHLGKTKGVPLLKIVFKNEKGVNDSCAWCISDVKDWKETIERIIKKQD